jgi:hypothetical protein
MSGTLLMFVVAAQLPKLTALGNIKVKRSKNCWTVLLLSDSLSIRIASQPSLSPSKIVYVDMVTSYLGSISTQDQCKV